MAGASARPVTREQLLDAKKRLELAARRLEAAIQVMIDSDLESIDMRAHVAMTTGVRGVCSMANEAQGRAEDASIAKDLGISTKIQRSKDRHAAYGTKPKRKPPS